MGMMRMLLLLVMMMVMIIIIIDTWLDLTLSRWHYIHQSIVIANCSVLQHSKQLHQYLYISSLGARHQLIVIVHCTVSQNKYIKIFIIIPDMIFVHFFTPPDFQVKNFTPLILPNFNSFGDKSTKSE